MTFSYDINGVLQVEVENAVHQTVTKLITNDALSQREIEDSLRRLEQLKLKRDAEEEYQLLLAKLEWLFEQQTGEVRLFTGSMIYHLKQARESGKHLSYRKAKDRAQAWLVQAAAAMEVFELSLGDVEDDKEDWDE